MPIQDRDVDFNEQVNLQILCRVLPLSHGQEYLNRFRPAGSVLSPAAQSWPGGAAGSWPSPCARPAPLAAPWPTRRLPHGARPDPHRCRAPRMMSAPTRFPCLTCHAKRCDHACEGSRRAYWVQCCAKGWHACLIRCTSAACVWSHGTPGEAMYRGKGHVTAANMQ